MLSAAVVTVSDRCAAGLREDRTGPALAVRIAAAGHRVAHAAVVPDDAGSLAALVGRLADGAVCGPVDVVLAAGGTGIGPRDRTPEALAAAWERPVPGIGERVRAASADRVPAASLSRACAGVRGRSLLVALPGSVGGACDGWDAIAGILEHARDQLHGGDHRAAARP